MDEEVVKDRRVQNIPVEVERRNDFMDPVMHSRVSVLETKMNTVEDETKETRKTVLNLMAKIESHIMQTSNVDSKLQQNLTAVTTSVEHLVTTVSETNKTLKEIAEKANSSVMKLAQIETIALTITKIATIAGIVVGAAWSFFLYLDKNDFNFSVKHGTEMVQPKAEK